MPKVSVIIPVYQVEAYLEQCVLSVREQTLSDIEIILVDDGSPDRCGSMCDAYALQDPRIKVIHKENGGLASARNAALEIAAGEFVGFVDSDDYIAPEMYERMYSSALENQSDFVMCGFYEMDRKGTWLPQRPNLPEGVYTREEAVRRMIVPLFGNDHHVGQKECNGYACMCMFRKSIIDEQGLTFQSERRIFHEDEVFQLDFFLYIKTASFVDAPLYYYRYNQQSLSRVPHTKQIWEVGRNLIAAFRDFSRRYGLEEECRRRIDLYLLFYVVYAVRNECLESLHSGTGKQHRENLRAIFTDPEVQRVLASPLPAGESKENRFILLMARWRRPALVYYVYHSYYKFCKR